jgi:6-phosphogluconolactonase
MSPKWILLGTDKGKGIYRAAWNAATGEVGAPELAAEAVRPAYLAMHPTLPVLYSANEAPNVEGSVSSFRVDRSNGSLTELNSFGSHGIGPCYVSVDATRAYAANYNSGSLGAYGIDKDGFLVDTVAGFDCLSHPGACGALGPVKSRQDGPHFHCAVIAPAGQILVCDLGSDAIFVFSPPKEALAVPLRYATRPGSGPRHVAFHPNGRWVYCIHELDCTIDLFDWDVTAGHAALTSRADSAISTLATPAHLPGSTACELVLSDDGRFLYANTRGEDSLVVYRIDPKTGLLSEQQRLASGGKVTRHIAFDPTRRWLLCAHQGSSAITVFAHDTATGKLSESPKTFTAETPMFIQFV